MAQFDPRKLGRNVKRTYTILGSELTTGFIILSEQGYFDAGCAVEDYFKEKSLQKDLVHPGNVDALYTFEKTCQEIYRYCVDSDYINENGAYRKFFKSVEDVRLLSPTQLFDLEKSYQAWRKEVEEPDDSQLEELKKNCDAITKETIAWNTLIQLLYSMENDKRILQRASGLTIESAKALLMKKEKPSTS